MRDGRPFQVASFPKLVLAAALVLAPGLAWAAPVKGRVSGVEKLMNPVWNEAKEVSSRRFTFREPSPTVRADHRQLFAYAPKEVCIAAIGTAKPPPTNRPTVVTVGGGRTTPVTIVVAPGTRLKFENRDPFPHRLYMVGESSFAAADQPAMASREWTAQAPGTYEIRDELAPSVRAWVVVEEGVYAFTHPGQNNVFEFSDLPAGSFTLKAFFSGEEVARSEIQVGSGALDLREPMKLVASEKKPEKPEKPAAEEEKE